LFAFLRTQLTNLLKYFYVFFSFVELIWTGRRIIILLVRWTDAPNVIKSLPVFERQIYLAAKLNLSTMFAFHVFKYINWLSFLYMVDQPRELPCVLGIYSSIIKTDWIFKDLFIRLNGWFLLYVVVLNCVLAIWVSFTSYHLDFVARVIHVYSLTW
jgi:hypothetical protein